MARLLFHLGTSTDDPPRTAAAILAAWQNQEAGHEVSFWLVGEGVRLAVKGVAETLRERVPRPAAELLEQLAAGGARLQAEAAAFAAREFEPAALRPGGEIVAGEELGTRIDEGWTLVPG